MCKIVETENLVKWYGASKVIDDISFIIKPGEIYGLIGKNGAGKTTIMKLILSMVHPSAGTVKLFWENTKQNKNLHNRVGALIEAPAFYPFFSARENLEYYSRVKGLKCSQEIDKLLVDVGLGEAGNKKYKDFSLGMKQRLGIALALLGTPQLLVLDEPTNGLDPVGIKEIRDLLLKYNREYGTTIFISSHILSELSHLATKYGVVHDGKLLDEIESKDLKQDLEEYFLEAINS